MPVQPDENRPSARIVDQRMRNRLIEALQLAASFELQQREPGNAVNETINKWEDVDPVRWGWRLSDVYSEEEQAAVQAFHETWDAVADRLPQEKFPKLDDVQRRPEWHELRDAAGSALKVFTRRGLLPEDREV